MDNNPKTKRSVTVGASVIGGGAPVTVQSMCNTKTADVEATVAQIQRLTDAGCDIVRVTCPDMESAGAIRRIRDRISIPLVADIHFDYRLAIAAMENGAHKIRFNPGNIGDRSRVEKVVTCAKAHKVPLRIGVNAGSIEKELKEKYSGETPKAMVESALKHVAILEACGFYDMVLSLKASTVADTVKACRIMNQACDYPLHIGVTETGDLEQGTIKSAIGIGALLMDGIGDTLRVSLTGDPVLEVETGLRILRALHLRNDDVEIVSCPTCGRTRVDLLHAVDEVKRRLPRNRGYLKVAVMGCAVNGPGEAADADIGIAFGADNGVIFKRGLKWKSGSMPGILDLMIQEAAAMLG